jgi:hypothetical protein
MPAKLAWCRSPANSSPANIAANPPKTRIPPTAAKRFGWSRPALNPQKDVFSIRLRPSAWGGPHAVLKALGRGRRFYVRRRKPAFGGVNPLDLSLIPLASVHFLKRVKICKVVKGLPVVNFCFFHF